MIEIKLIDGRSIKAPITYKEFLKEINSPFFMLKGGFVSMVTPDKKVLISMKNVVSVVEFND